MDGPLDRWPIGRTGIASDIHGNTAALAAVLADGVVESVDRWLVLGDVVAMGPEPVEVLELLDRVEVVATISGNTERYVLSGDLPEPTFDQVVADPAKLPRLVEVAATFGWTSGYLSAHDRRSTLEGYVASFRFVLPDGTRMLAVHASLVSDEGVGITPDLSGEVVAELFPEHGADVILGGHTHQPTDVEVLGARFVNPGSVSNHHHSELSATYSILEAGAAAHRFHHREVSYPKQHNVDAIRASGMPGCEFLIGRYFPDLV